MIQRLFFFLSSWNTEHRAPGEQITFHVGPNPEMRSAAKIKGGEREEKLRKNNCEKRNQVSPYFSTLLAYTRPMQSCLSQLISSFAGLTLLAVRNRGYVRFPAMLLQIYVFAIFKRDPVYFFLHVRIKIKKWGAGSLLLGPQSEFRGVL